MDSMPCAFCARNSLYTWNFFPTSVWPAFPLMVMFAVPLPMLAIPPWVLYSFAATVASSAACTVNSGAPTVLTLIPPNAKSVANIHTLFLFIFLFPLSLHKVSCHYQTADSHQNDSQCPRASGFRHLHSHKIYYF